MIKRGAVLILALGLSVAAMGKGNAILIAQVNNRVGDNTQYYQYVNDNALFPGGTGTFVTTVVSVPTLFTFNVPGTPFGGPVLSRLQLFSSVNDGTMIANIQPQKNFTFKIIVDPADPTYGGAFGNQVLLQGGSSTARIQDNGGTVQFGGSDTALDNVNLSSNFLTLSGLKSFTWSYSEITPAGTLTPNPNNFILDNWLFGGNGNFRADTASTVPEPGVASSLIGVGIVGSLLAIRRRRRA